MQQQRSAAGSQNYAFDRTKKLVIVGDSGVGKSCLLLRFTDNYFSETQESTIAVDFRTKTLVVNELKIKLQVWDTAGQERFRSLIPSYLRNAEGALLAFELTKIDTLQNLSTWHRSVIEFGTPALRFVVVGTKADMASQREVSRDAAEEFARSIGAPYFETSAKTGQGIEDAFVGLVKLTLESGGADSRQTGRPDGAAAPSTRVAANNLSSGGSPKKKSGGCC